ncbi:MAG TPA: acyl-CoA dehydrogenase family protein [Actinomycetes bacterium]|jgi:alkylation response protein AidB-like acyl-CoA dehydrogenase|nr:acyl-CoA dehydrogenase family protein [Actinomycetes bacterium]
MGLDAETLTMILDAIRGFAAGRLPNDRLLELDALDEFPSDEVRAMCGEELGIHLLFIPEAYGGMAGDAVDTYRVCEQMAAIDVGVATGVFATFLGSEPIIVGGTPDQQKRWLSRIAEEGLLFAYGATEPEAGSDLGALRSRAEPLERDGKVAGYVLNGKKQWISNGGVADAYCVLANAPGGPSWFVVERDTPGFGHAKPEDKHGIRLSNTAALLLDEVRVDADRLLGGVEGQGLVQAQQVFGYTRLMVAAFGLGAGWEALRRAIEYSRMRVQAGAPLAEKQGYTHKLIVPHAVRLEAARAYTEVTAERIDAGEGTLNTEGAIAKYLATEAGNLAADAAIQALGGYGYTREFMVEKIRRDVRITTIYEGTSEIMEMTIGRDRWQLHIKTRGDHYHAQAGELEALHAAHPEVGADAVALGLHAAAVVLERARTGRLTRNQHVLFRLGELLAVAEGAASFAKRAARAAEGTLGPKADRRFPPDVLAAMSRVNAREAALKVATDGLRWVGGALATGDELTALQSELDLPATQRAQAGLLSDMDRVRDALYGAPVAR